jgi:hypothetical protein
MAKKCRKLRLQIVAIQSSSNRLTAEHGAGHVQSAPISSVTVAEREKNPFFVKEVFDDGLHPLWRKALVGQSLI